MIERLKVLQPSFTYLENTCFTNYKDLHVFYEFITLIEFKHVNGDLYELNYLLEDDVSNFKGTLSLNIKLNKDNFQLIQCNLQLDNLSNKYMKVINCNKILKNGVFSRVIEVSNNLEFVLDNFNNELTNLLTLIYTNRKNLNNFEISNNLYGIKIPRQYNHQKLESYQKVMS